MEHLRVKAIILLACFSSLAHAQSIHDVIGSGMRLKNANIPLWNLEPKKELLAIVHVNDTYIDYQRKFFFKIGALPIAVLEGTTITVHNPASITNSLARLATWSTPQGAERLELRKFKLLIGTNRLEAGRVRFISHGKWELADGAVLFTGTNAIHSSSGTFYSTGKQAGEVVLQTIPPTTNSFLVR